MADTVEEAYQDLSSLLNCHDFCDVELEVDSKRIPCHRAILAHRCRFFQAMFLSDMKESKQKVVNLHGFSYDVVKAVVQFLYTGRFDTPSMEEKKGEKKNTYQENKSNQLEFLADILKASDFYELKSMYNLCLNEIVKLITSSTPDLKLPQRVFELGNTHDIECLKDQACVVLGKSLTIKTMCLKQSPEKEYAEMSDEIKEHLEEVWEGELKQQPMVFGPDKELWDTLTSVKPPYNKVVERVEGLIEKGAKPTKVGAIHRLCEQWHVENQEEAEVFNELLNIFIDEGCDINRINHTEHTPLHIAASNFNSFQVEALLSYGADPCIKCSKHHFTPQQEAAYGFDEHSGLLSESSSPTGKSAIKKSTYKSCQTVCRILAMAVKKAPMAQKYKAEEKESKLSSEFIESVLLPFNRFQEAHFKGDYYYCNTDAELQDSLFAFKFPSVHSRLQYLNAMQSGRERYLPWKIKEVRNEISVQEMSGFGVV